MSFINNAIDLLNRTEASLDSLIADAVKAKAYRDVAQIASLAESVAAITANRPGTSRASEFSASAGTPSVEPARAAEPSWMRPKV